MEEKANQFITKDLLKVLLTFKSHLMKTLKVADIFIVKSVKTEKNVDIYECKALNNENTIINCFALSSLTDSIDKGSVVLVLFTDSDFRTNYKRLKNSQQTQTSESILLHDFSYGVIIGLLS